MILKKIIKKIYEFFINRSVKKQHTLYDTAGLTGWEKNFLKSIEGKKNLSFKQSLKLKEIVEKKL